MSQREIARITGLSSAHVSLLESGKRNDLDASTVAALATLYGVTMDWLWSGNVDSPDPESVKSAFEKARLESAA